LSNEAPPRVDLGPEYLKSGDFAKDDKWQIYTLKIKEVLPGGTVKGKDGTPIKHPIVVFENAKKRLVLGKTNHALMVHAAGSNVESEWVGKTIRLTVHMLPDAFGVKNVTTIRIHLMPSDSKPFIRAKDMGICLAGKRVSPAS
jgi:hypothetical protein